jgi:N-carbamoylputrescine amidase
MHDRILARMRITVCQLPDERERFDAEWDALCAHARGARSELVLLPELPFARWFAVKRTFNARTWRDAIDAHRDWESRLRELGAPVVIGTRAVERDARRLNEAFIATPDRTSAFHHKRYLPDEEGFWEASWYGSGDGVFDLVQANGAAVGAQICTEMWMLDVSRQYGLRGADIIAVPRATPGSTRDRWVVGGRAAAIVSGAFCISSNRSGVSSEGDAFAGQGWIIDPEGEVLALTSDTDRWITRDLDLERARGAKTTYPRYVR